MSKVHESTIDPVRVKVNFLNPKRVSIIFFPNIASLKTDDLSNLCPNITPPEGFSIIGGDRKFVVLIRDEEFVIAIGPQNGATAYSKQDLCRLSKKKYYPNFTETGSGKITFSCGPYASPNMGNKWDCLVKITGRSHATDEYGIFNHMRDEIITTLVGRGE